MRGKKPDHEVIKSVLRPMQVADYIPPEIEHKLNQYSVEELHQIFIQGCNLTSLIMAQKGWILMEIKKRVGHGNFRDHLRELKVSYEYGRRCMNVARAIGRHPDLAKIQDSNLLRRVVYLPDSKQEQIAVKLKQHIEYSGPDGKPVKRTEEWHDLRPWILEQIGYAFEKKRERPKKTYPDVEITITTLDTLFNKAVSALKVLGDYEIPQAEHEKAKRYTRELTRAWDRAIYNLGDPAHEYPPLWEDSRPSARDIESVEDEED